MTNPSLTNKKQLHFILELKGCVFIYVYIRKNACSAWKKLFIKESKYANYAKGYKNPLDFMGKYHKIKNIDKIKRIKNRIVVLRNPVDRLVSGFINQFIMRMDRISDLHKKVQEFTGIDYRHISFQEFLELYLFKAPEEYLDAHFWTQTSHMAPIKYNQVWLIENLHKESANLFGQEIADRYFLRKINATLNIPRYEKEAYRQGGIKLFKKYKKKGALPSRKALLSDELKEKVESYYYNDIKLYDGYQNISKIKEPLVSKD